MTNKDPRMSFETIYINGIKRVLERSIIVYLGTEEKIIPRSCLRTKFDRDLSDEENYLDLQILDVATWLVKKENLG